MKFENGAIINFDKRKTFRYVKKLGEGGTGDTHLLSYNNEAIIETF